MKFFFQDTSQPHDAIVERLIQRIAQDNAIDAPDTNCSAMLIEAVIAALAYARSLVEALGEPVALDRRTSAGSTLGPILFDTFKVAVDSLRDATPVRAVFADRHARECVFLLTMRRHEYVVYGTEIQGEMARRDVLQDAVEFRDHNFSAAAPSLSILRDILAENVLLFLINSAKERRHRDEAMRAALQQSGEILKAQMQTLRCALRESNPFAAPTPLHAKALKGEMEMETLNERLSALSSKSASYSYLQEIRNILLAPQHHVQLEVVEMRVGDFGVKTETGKLIRFHECILENEERLAVFMASLDRENAKYLWPDLEG